MGATSPLTAAMDRAISQTEDGATQLLGYDDMGSIIATTMLATHMPIVPVPKPDDHNHHGAFAQACHSMIPTRSLDGLSNSMERH